MPIITEASAHLLSHCKLREMEGDVPTPWKAAPSLLQSSEEAADGKEKADGCLAWDEEASRTSLEVIDMEDPDDKFDAADW